MPFFLYRARDSQGLLITGELEAGQAEEIKTRLADQGLIPLTVRKAGPHFEFTLKKKLFSHRIKSEELIIMTRQFFTLFKAGMNMEGILSTIARQTGNKTLKEALQRIRTDVAAGGTLSASFAKHPDAFSELYVNMIAAGEEAGILEEVLRNLSQLLEKENEIKVSVKSATLYPKIVMGVLVMASTVLMTVVVPKFAAFYGHYKAELPLPTQIMIQTSSFLAHRGYLVLLAAVGLVYAFVRYRRTVRGAVKIDRLRFRMPVFGEINKKVANARFCHLLASLYRSGLPLTRCLEITGGTIDNKAFEREIELLRGEVLRGKSISQGMADCHYFTPIVVEATAVGERTGSLDEMLASMGEHYDLEVHHTLKNLTTMLEPFLLFFIFGMVTLFALAIFLPIWNMSKAVSGH